MPSFHLLTVGGDPSLHRIARTVLDQLRPTAPPFTPAEHPVYARTLAAARSYLDDACPELTMRLTQLAGPEELPGAMEELRQNPVLVVIDAATTPPRPDSAPPGLTELRAATARPPSSAWVHVYDDGADGIPYSYGRFDCTVRQLPEEDWVLAAQLVSAVADAVQDHLARPARPAEVSRVARALAGFLTARSGSRWGLHPFTGSVVSKLITDLTALAGAGGNPVLRGPSEHSLACAAMARWQLARAPFLLVATAAMTDELRGTLANLRDTGAQGFILFGEPPAHGWMPFQGVVHSAEDAREVFAARGLTCVYLDDPDQLDDGLRRAAEAYDAGEGPVVLLATPPAPCA